MTAPNTTPGPWVVAEDRFGGRLVVRSSDTTVAYAAVGDGEIEDAHLIAAAPELYEALNAIMLAVEAGHAAVRHGLVADATAALRKARGVAA